MKTFVLRNVNKGIKIITFCDIKKKNVCNFAQQLQS